MLRKTPNIVPVSLIKTSLAAMLSMTLIAGSAFAQEGAVPPRVHEDSASTSKQIAELEALIQKLQSRVSDLEQKLKATDHSAPTAPGAVADSHPTPAATPGASAQSTPATASRSDFNILRGTTVNFLFDGYYNFNFNNPIGRVNLLRAYDVSANAFSLNQAGIVIENAPDPEHGKRFGLRLDLQYGQATASLQGNPANEPRPDLYRNIFQAYGTYVLPIGNGLTVDFGKWAGSLGMEGTYTKDQINYSRSYWFNFLPFYHMGARVNYKVNRNLAVNYWITNGTQQTEPFNGFKDQMFGLNIQPHKNVAWTINYYFGQEHPDFRYVPGSTQPNLPTQQGIPFEPIPNAPDGKLHIFDSYVTWAVTPKLTLAGEGDYVISRLLTSSAPSRTTGGAAYARYQLTPKLAVAGRAEYLSDRGGLFTGATQILRDATITLEQKITDGLILRQEWRRDASNHPYFLTDNLGVLKKEQNTASLGLVWWFGGKEGAW